MSTRSHYQRKAAIPRSYAEPAESDDESDREWGGGSSSVKDGQHETQRGDETDSGNATNESSGDEFRLGQARRRKARRPHEKAKRSKETKKRDEAEEGKKPSLPKRGTRVGKLEAVKLVPMEILLEIFSHLGPADLLSLSMINKRFRSVLTGDKSAHVWRQARGRYDLPEVTSGNLSSLQLVRLDHLKRLNPAAHPLVRDCVIPSLCTPNNMRRLGSQNWAHINDVEYWSNRLWKLEYENASASAATSVTGAAERAESVDARDGPDEPEAHGRRGRRQSKKPSYVESDSETEPVEQRYGQCASVRRLVQERVKYVEGIVEDGRRLHIGERKMLKQLQAEKSGFRRLDQRYNDAWADVLERVVDIESRVLEEVDDFSESDSLDSRFYCDPLIASQAPLSDDGWDIIKDDVFKLIAKNRQLRAGEKLVGEAQARQRALRPRYKELFDSLSTAVQPYMPLFTDFLLFESVRPLWSSETAASDQAWLEAVDLIKEECDGYRVDLAALAQTLADHDAKMTVQTATEIDLEPNVDLMANSNRTGSFVACAFENCDQYRIYPDFDTYWKATSGDMSTVGPVYDVLRHQHAAHNFADELKKKTDFKATAVPGYHLKALPLELVCAVSALVDLAQLEPEIATKEDLVGFDATVSEYDWENKSGNTRYFSRYSSLLAGIKKETERARKFGLHLEPPVIVAKFKAAEEDEGR